MVFSAPFGCGKVPLELQCFTFRPFEGTTKSIARHFTLMQSPDRSFRADGLDEPPAASLARLLIAGRPSESRESVRFGTQITVNNFVHLLLQNR